MSVNRSTHEGHDVGHDGFEPMSFREQLLGMFVVMLLLLLAIALTYL